MIRVLLLLLLAVLAWRLVTGRWPWQGRGRPRRTELERARALLGVDGNARREDIIEAHKALIARVHPDRGGTSDMVHEANAARELLLAELVPARKE